MKIEALYTLKNPEGGVLSKGVYSDKSEKGVPQVLIDEARRGAKTVRLVSGKLPSKEEKTAKDEVVTTQDTASYETMDEPSAEEEQTAPTTTRKKPRRKATKTAE